MVQELSADDLDNVSGGCGSMDGVACVCVSDPDRGILSVDKYCERVKWTYDSYGLETASVLRWIYTRRFLPGRRCAPAGRSICATLWNQEFIHFITGENFNSCSIRGTWS